MRKKKEATYIGAWFKFFEDYRKYEKDTKFIIEDDKETYLVYMYHKGLEYRTIIKASEEQIQIFKKNIDEVIGVKKMTTGEIEASKILQMPIYQM